MDKTSSIVSFSAHLAHPASYPEHLVSSKLPPTHVNHIKPYLDLASLYTDFVYNLSYSHHHPEFKGVPKKSTNNIKVKENSGMIFVFKFFNKLFFKTFKISL